MGAIESLAGRVLADKYLLVDRLGEGGFGSIWRAEHRVLKSPVAVKLIDLDMARKDGAVERFLREAQATAALRSPHVVQVLDYGVDGDQPFIVMELMDGENLAERIQRVGPLPAMEVVRIVTHVARAMAKAHELGIVHRDLKPENIFLVNNGDEEVAKVLDFGVAKFAMPVDVQQDTYTITGSLIGTPYYMSPEQAQGNKAVDHRSDLWALGVITFEMLTGKRPFDGDALGDLVLTICVRSIAVPSAVAAVPPGFDAWFARAVERQPEARFQSARELALALLRVVEGEEAVSRYATIEERLGQRPSIPDVDMAVDIPSRPYASPFAQTVRDDALAAGILNASSVTPHAALDERVGERGIADGGRNPDGIEEEGLTPWSVIGIAVLALAAGAAAVYGVFFLVRAHDDSNVPPEAIVSAMPHVVTPPPAATSRHRFDVIATSKPNNASEPTSNRAPRPALEASAELSKLPAAPAGALAQSPNNPVAVTNPAASAVLPPTFAAEPAAPITPTAPPLAPPVNLAPETLAPEPAPAPTPAPAPAPVPAPARSGEPQPLESTWPPTEPANGVAPTGPEGPSN